MIDVNKRVCKKCLLRDFSSSEYKEHIKIYLEGIDKDRKTPKDLYENRLQKCRECEALRDGLCAKCGCFVEFRASIRSNQCPKSKKEW